MKYNTTTIIVIIRKLYYKMLGKSIVAHPFAIIKGIRNITMEGNLYVGYTAPKFSYLLERTLVKVEGRLHIKGMFKIGRGSRFYIGPNSQCMIDSGYITANSSIFIYHGLKIGKNVAISWNVEILDEDFHYINYPGKLEIEDKTIEIGDNVWIGSGVKILKGVKIGNNCVIAANSLVTKSFKEENVLIAGAPAKIIKRGIEWGQLEDKSFMHL